MKKIIIFLILTIIGLLSYILFWNKKNPVENILTKSSGVSILQIASTSPKNEIDAQGNKTFVFNAFHGSSDISDKFSFKYPAVWNNDGYYFSPERIEYYDQNNVRAAFYFDLIQESIFPQSDIKYQIDNSKRKSPDMVGKLDGRDFKKYDLIDYGSYGGSSAGRVIIYLGPKIKIDGAMYYLVFHWEEMPFLSSIPANSSDVFEKVVSSIDFQ